MKSQFPAYNSTFPCAVVGSRTLVSGQRLTDALTSNSGVGVLDIKDIKCSALVKLLLHLLRDLGNI